MRDQCEHGAGQKTDRDARPGHAGEALDRRDRRLQYIDDHAFELVEQDRRAGHFERPAHDREHHQAWCYESEQAAGIAGPIDRAGGETEDREIEQIGDDRPPQTVEMILEAAPHLAPVERRQADPVDRPETTRSPQHPYDNARRERLVGHGRSL
ncbi:MAG: hypothetical protein WD715_00840 [Dongiaceae bacterium]